MSHTTPHTLVRSLQGDTLSAIVWRTLGAGPGRTEAVLDANPGLADLPPVLPAGVAVRIPAIPRNTSQAAPVRLWD